MSDTLKRRALAAALATVIAVPAEGLRQMAYYDPPGILTVCRGHTGSDIDPRKIYTIPECDALLTADMRRSVEEVDRCIPDAPVNVLAAFGDAAYNLGPRIACDPHHSTAARKLQAKDWAGACRELPKWDKARVAGFLIALPGLTARRKMEMDLCVKSS
jgi:GH24 family phage-related lysozyme (muramidase)